MTSKYPKVEITVEQVTRNGVIEPKTYDVLITRHDGLYGTDSFHLNSREKLELLGERIQEAIKQALAV